MKNNLRCIWFNL